MTSRGNDFSIIANVVTPTKETSFGDTAYFTDFKIDPAIVEHPDGTFLQILTDMPVYHSVKQLWTAAEQRAQRYKL